jgi:hypothetical protein
VGLACSFVELSAELAPLAGLTALLTHAAAAGWGLALVTNAPRPTAALMIKGLGLERWSPLAPRPFPPRPARCNPPSNTRSERLSSAL